MINQEKTPGQRFSPRLRFCFRWLMIVGALLITHLASARMYWNRYETGFHVVGSRTMSLEMSQEEWASTTLGADSSAYLRVARQVASGQGVTVQVPGADPPRAEPFTYWGPGAPVGLGAWLALVGGDTMRTFFWFALVCQLFAGAMAIATIRLFTKSTAALVLTAALSGFCPPLQEWFYGINLTSSEIVSVVPLWIMFFALCKGFLAYRAAAQDTRWRAICWPATVWFAVAGLLIGVHSLIRDSGAVLGTFVAVFVLGRAILADRKRLKTAIAIAAVSIVAVIAVRQPVRLWNKQRTGQSLVCGSSAGAIWRYGLWMKHDKFDWYESSGIGLGEFLNPEGAKRVEDYYLAGRKRPELYSLLTLLEGVAEHPGEAVMFKLSRLPVLWLGTDRWPNSRLTLSSAWCLAMYGVLAALVVAARWRRQYLPEPMYLYILLIVCASPLIHFEFRYTFPAWQMLTLAPGLLLSVLSPHSLQNSDDSDKQSIGDAIQRLIGDWRHEAAEAVVPSPHRAPAFSSDASQVRTGGDF